MPRKKGRKKTTRKKKNDKGGTGKKEFTGLYPAFDKSWAEAPIQPNDSINYTDYFTTEELAFFYKKISKEKTGSKKRNVMNEMKRLAAAKGYIHTKACNKYPNELLDVFKKKYKGSELAAICMNNWYRVYTRPGVEYKKTGRRGKQQIKKNYFDLKGYLVNNVFKRGPMVVERWTSAPIDILQSQRVNIGNSSLRMPSRRFRRRVIKLYSDKYELDNMVVNPTKTDEPSKKSKNSSEKYIDYEALFSQAPDKKAKTKGGAGSRSKSKSKSKSKSSRGLKAVSPDPDPDPFPPPPPEPVRDEHGCYRFLDNPLFPDVDGIYVSVGIKPDSDDVIKEFIGKTDHDGNMKIESNYSSFYSGEVMWEELMDEDDDHIAEMMDIYNIRSLEDCIKLHTNAYIVSVIEIFDKKIISEKHLLTDHEFIYLYNSARKNVMNQMADTAGGLWNIQRNGGGCCPFFYDGCIPSLLTKNLVLSGEDTRSR